METPKNYTGDGSDNAVPKSTKYNLNRRAFFERIVSGLGGAALSSGVSNGADASEKAEQSKATEYRHPIDSKIDGVEMEGVGPEDYLLAVDVKELGDGQYEVYAKDPLGGFTPLASYSVDDKSVNNLPTRRPVIVHLPNHSKLTVKWTMIPAWNQVTVMHEGKKFIVDLSRPHVGVSLSEFQSGAYNKGKQMPKAYPNVPCYLAHFGLVALRHELGMEEAAFAKYIQSLLQQNQKQQFDLAEHVLELGAAEAGKRMAAFVAADKTRSARDDRSKLHGNFRIANVQDANKQRDPASVAVQEDIDISFRVPQSNLSPSPEEAKHVVYVGLLGYGSDAQGQGGIGIMQILKAMDLIMKGELKERK